MVLFKNASEENESIRKKNISSPSEKNIHWRKIPRKKINKANFVQKTRYRILRILIGIIGFLWVKYTSIRRSIDDYGNGDVWWCVLGLASLVLPSFPFAIHWLRRQIREENLKQESDLVKPFFRLFLLLIFYLFGGFIIVAVYRIFYKVYCTCQNIRFPCGQDNGTEYRRREVEMTYIQALLEAAPDGLLQVVDIKYLFFLLRFSLDLQVPSLPRRVALFGYCTSVVECDIQPFIDTFSNMEGTLFRKSLSENLCLVCSASRSVFSLWNICNHTSSIFYGKWI